jgi:hypothetical protein
MRGTITLALLVVLASAQGLAQPPEQSRDEPILEALIRSLVREYCKGYVCYFSVEKSRPSDRLVKRLESSTLLAVPAGGFTIRNRPKEYQWLLDVGPVVLQSDGQARVGGDVGEIGGRLLMSCSYLLRRAETGWRVITKETSCAII